MTRDDALLYAAESDLDQVFVIDARTHEVLSRVAVGRQPEKVLVASDDTVYVTNRLDRSVSVLRRGETTEAARLQVAVEPVGLAASADARTLYVVNATSLADADFGTVMAFDTASRTLKWEMAVGPEPRGIALLGDGRAAVTLYKSGDVVFLDAATGQVLKAGTDVYEQLNRTSLGIATGGDRPPMPMPDASSGLKHPRGLEAIAASPDGTQLYVAGLLSAAGVLGIPSTSAVPGGDPSATGSGYGGGACGSAAVVSPAVLTFDRLGHAQVDDVLTCAGGSSSRPGTILSSIRDGRGAALQQPKALATDSSGAYLFVADFASNNVAVVRASTPAAVGVDFPAGAGGSVDQLVAVGEGPTGIAVSHDGRRAWVHTVLDHSVARLETQDGQVRVSASLRLADDVLAPDVVAGRKLFYSAVDARMDSPSLGISCGSCHLEGREDGHVWNFSDGPRQTPSLAGRMVAKTAPYHWSGEFSSFGGFMDQTVKARMGGTGATPAMEAQLVAFLDAQPTPDNPNRGARTAAVQRGEQLFARAECTTCHGGEAYTLNNFADVGTFARGGVVADRTDTLPHGGLNTPSLLGVARTAPYLHDGSATTLKARLLQGKALNLHGKTADLSDGDVDDLVAYLKTL